MVENRKNINDLILNIIDVDHTYTKVNKSNWQSLSYNDIIIIKKNTGSMGRYYFKGINSNFLFCSTSRCKSDNNKNFKYIPIRYSLKNIKVIYRQSKFYTDIDMMLIKSELDEVKNELKNIVYVVQEIINHVSKLKK